MTPDNLNDLKQIQKNYLRDRDPIKTSIHPWRKDWKYIVLHEYRVEKYVETIINSEKLELSVDDVLLTRSAAIVHDIGKHENKMNHAEKSAKIILTMFENGLCSYFTENQMKKLYEMISKHSNKEERDNSNICLNILKDADLLDEIGMMSIFMAGNWINKEDPFYFNEVQKRIEQYEIKFCEKGNDLLYTRSAKEILKEKKNFIEFVNHQLKNELMGISEL